LYILREVEIERKQGKFAELSVDPRTQMLRDAALLVDAVYNYDIIKEGKTPDQLDKGGW
jgi:hypothetical protein